MAEANAISDLQAVDFAVGGVIVGAYDGLRDDKPEAFRRFLNRPARDKIFRAENEDPPSLIRRIARHNPGKKKVPDLPVVAYYRSPGIVGNQNEKPVVLDVERHIDDTPRAMRLSSIPVTLSYSLLWCAWDKPTLDKITLAWFAYVAHRGRKYSRFSVPYRLGSEPIEIPASISVPREIQADNASGEQAEGRLWAARALVEVNTQVLYGREVQPVDEITALGQVRLI
ncbi:hypothetical protein [Desulfovibrio sp. SGI.169]|uniref:hypothetical protein n=1 Tax=Desulfovibrio sp. SGI.169 TaxID=3420561 RepID=UPI003D01D76F